MAVAASSRASPCLLTSERWRLERDTGRFGCIMPPARKKSKTHREDGGVWEKVISHGFSCRTITPQGRSRNDTPRRTRAHVPPAPPGSVGTNDADLVHGPPRSRLGDVGGNGQGIARSRLGTQQCLSTDVSNKLFCRRRTPHLGLPRWDANWPGLATSPRSEVQRPVPTVGQA